MFLSIRVPASFSLPNIAAARFFRPFPSLLPFPGSSVFWPLTSTLTG